MAIKGLKNGMVMQRDKDNLCEVYFESDKPVKSVTVSDEYSTPTIEKQGEKYCLKGIRVGGPYTLTIDDETFSDMYVGDVWLLTGQSNMQGVGRKVNIPHNDNDKIRAFYMQGKWDKANHPLHNMGEAIHKVHQELGSQPGIFNIKGVGPGLAFAQKMFDLTGVPQGVIPCAHGGTNLYEHWSPERMQYGPDHSLYAATYDRFLMNGANCRGIFWYQGCSDTHPDKDPLYTDNMINLVECFRRDFKEDLPFVQVQISRMAWAGLDDRAGHQRWTNIREQQRTLHTKIENFDTVNAIGYRLADCIHLNSDSQEIVGKDAAEAMYCLIWGKLYGCLPGIKLKKMEVLPDEYDENMSYVILEYDNVHGQLDGGMRPMGFDRAHECNKDFPEFCGISDVYCDGNRVTVRFDYKMEYLLDHVLWYGYGKNPSCNIFDSHGRSLPAFGPIKIENRTFE